MSLPVRLPRVGFLCLSALLVMSSGPLAMSHAQPEDPYGMMNSDFSARQLQADSSSGAGFSNTPAYSAAVSATIALQLLVLCLILVSA